MKNLLLMAFAILITGCAKTPDCSEPAMTELILSGIAEQYDKAISANLRNALSLQAISIEKHDEKLDKYACKAELVITHDAGLLKKMFEPAVLGEMKVSGLIADSLRKTHGDASDVMFGTYSGYLTSAMMISMYDPQVLTAEPNKGNPTRDAILETVGDYLNKENKIEFIYSITPVKNQDGKSSYQTEWLIGDEEDKKMQLHTIIHAVGLAIDSAKIKAKEIETSWTGDLPVIYSCNGVDGEATGARGPFQMNVAAKAIKNTDSLSEYTVSIDRTTNSGGAENLTGKFNPSSENSWILSGSGKNGPEDSWNTSFEVKKEKAGYIGAGTIKSEDGETLRQCTIEFPKK